MLIFNYQIWAKQVWNEKFDIPSTLGTQLSLAKFHSEYKTQFRGGLGWVWGPSLRWQLQIQDLSFRKGGGDLLGEVPTSDVGTFQQEHMQKWKNWVHSRRCTSAAPPGSTPGWLPIKWCPSTKIYTRMLFSWRPTTHVIIEVLTPTV